MLIGLKKREREREWVNYKLTVIFETETGNMHLM